MSNLMKKMPLMYDTETERVDGGQLHHYLKASIDDIIERTYSYYDDKLDDNGENVLSPTYKYYDAIPYDADLHISHFKHQDDDENKINSQNMEDNIFTSLNDISNIVRISFLLLPILLLLIFCIGIFFNVFFIKLLIITILFTPISLTLNKIIKNV